MQAKGVTKRLAIMTIPRSLLESLDALAWPALVTFPALQSAITDDQRKSFRRDFLCLNRKRRAAMMLEAGYRLAHPACSRFEIPVFVSAELDAAQAKAILEPFRQLLIEQGRMAGAAHVLALRELGACHD